MNLHLRLIIVMFRYLLRRNIPVNDVLAVSKLKFRVWIHDLDINLHLTNSRYLGFMDLGRTWQFAEAGLMPLFTQKKWQAVVNAQEITYIRELAPLKAFSLETRMLGWDEKYFYFEQRFMQNGRLHALAQVRGLFAKNGKAIPMQEALLEAGLKVTQPELPETILTWKILLDAKKRMGQKLDKAV